VSGAIILVCGGALACRGQPVRKPALTPNAATPAMLNYAAAALRLAPQKAARNADTDGVFEQHSAVIGNRKEGQMIIAIETSELH